MQRTAAEQATPHGAPLPELPSELVVSIVRAGKDGVFLVKMLRVCKAWRRAITAESASLWREAALARYPRLHAVLAVSPQPPCFRSLYRSQLTADLSSYADVNQSPSLDAYMLTAELQIRTAQVGPGTPNTVRRYKTIAHYSERMDRVVMEQVDPPGPGRILDGRMVLTKEPTYDAAPSCVTPLNFRRGDAMFVLYATRLSDLKTTRIVEICDAFDDNYEYADNENFDRYLQEGDERCIVFGTSYMECGHSMFDSDGNDPVIYASFAPSQMLFKFDFWERGRAANGDPEPIDEGQGPTGEIYMAREELQTYLRWHARWSD